MSDVEKQPEDGETKAEQKPRKGPTITIEGDPTEALRKLPASVLGKPEIEAATRLGEAVKVATDGFGSSISGSAMKSISELAKNVIGGSGIAEAMKSANVARGIVGKLDTPMMLPERPTLSPDVMGWHAEKEAAPVATRDAVWALADAVDSLAVSQRRSDRALIWLTLALAIMTALVVVLTALLVIRGG